MKRLDEFVLDPPRRGAKKRENYTNLLLRSCMDGKLYLTSFIEKPKNTFIDEATFVGISSKYTLQYFNFFMQRRVGRVDFVRPKQQR